MATACPNINTPEWKNLVEQTQSETLANLAFVQKGYKMPDVRPVTEIKKAIGFKPFVEDFTRIAAKLKRYNRIHGTSHKFEKELVYGNTFRLTMKYNYLSVNQEEQRKRDARYDRTLRIQEWDNFDYGYYDKLIEQKEAKEKTEKTTFDTHQRDINFFRGDKALMEQEDADFMIPSAPEQITQIEYIRNKKIHNEINKVKSALRIEKDAKKAYELHNKLQNLNVLKEETTLKIAQAKDVKSYEGAIIIGQEQLEEVRVMLLKDTLSNEELIYASRILSFWLKAGDFSGDPSDHPILDEDEFNTPEIKEQFYTLKKKAESYASTIGEIVKDNVTEFVREYTHGNLTEKDIYSPVIDASKLGATTTSIGNQKDPILKAIHSAVERKNMEAQNEAKNLWDKVDALAKKVLKKSNNFKEFQQLDEFGRPTTRLVSRFSDAFYSKRQELSKKAFQTYEKGKIKKTKASVDAYYKWIADNTLTFDYRILFPDQSTDSKIDPFLYQEKTYTAAEKLAHETELKKHLGEKGFAFYMARVEKLLEKFQVAREAELLRLENDDSLSEDERKFLFTSWNKEHSPYWIMELQEKPELRKKGKDDFYSPKYTYITQIPKKFIGTEKTTWYDENYEKIEADNDLFEFHNLITETLNSLALALPEHQKGIMSYGVIPFMQKSLMDRFSEKGMMMGVVPFWDMLKEMSTTTDQATELFNDVDPNSRNIKKEIQINFVVDNRAKINDRVRILTTQHKQKTGQAPTAEELKQFKSIAREEITKTQSWDLVKILKAYSLSVLAHKHQSEIAPIVELARNTFKDKEEIVTNKAGAPLKKFGKVQTTPGATNLLSALDYFLASEHFKTGARKIEGVTNKKVLTSEEEKKKKELTKLLETETDSDIIEFLKEELDKLGSNLTVSGTGDMLLKLQNLRGMGWNLRAAFSNVAFGMLSNLIQGSGDDLVKQANLRKAYLLTINSVIKNNTFGMVDSPNKTGTKIRSLMDKYNLLQSIKTETFASSTASTFNKMKALAPLTLSERTEYLNQAPLMVAVMMDFEAKNEKGDTVSLWEAMGPNGELKEGYTTEVDEIKMAQKIKKIIEMNHGDYSNPLQVKETLSGRALSQFRTWMFEGFRNRFQEEDPDYILSYGNKNGEVYVKKGRYRSYTAGQMLTAGAVIGSTFLPGIGTVVGGTAGALVGKAFSTTKSEDSIWADALFTSKQLVRKLYGKTKFGDKFDATDAANMRKNMTELYMLVILSGIGIAIKAGLEDDDEDQMAATFLLNQTSRLLTDINFYTSPIELEKLTKTAVPATDLIFDLNTWRKDVANYLNDDEADDTFKSGPFAKQSKALIHGLELFPGASQIISTYRSSQTVVDK